MARGWESKSVEEQIEARAADAGKGPARPANAAEVARDQKRQGLLLARARVLQQIEKTENLGYRKMLEQALADLERQLAAL